MERRLPSVGMLVSSLVFSAVLASAAGAQTHSVGTLGATIPAKSWERKTLNGDLGPDQFLRADLGLFMVFLETFGLYEQRSDFEETLDLFLANVEAQAQEAEIDEQMGYDRTERFTRATRRFTGLVSGLRLGYELDLVSAGDGVGYLVMSWGAESRFDRLQQEVESTLSELELPGPDSEWSAQATPTEHSFEFGDWTLGLTFRDSVFSPSDSVPGERYTLVGDDGTLALHLFLDVLEGDADSVLDQVKETASSDGEFEELERRGVDLEIGSGRELLMRATGDSQLEVAIAVVGLEEDRWVDLRMVSENRTGHRDRLWDVILGSLTASQRERVDAFPTVAVPRPTRSRYLSDAARELLEGSEMLARASSLMVTARVRDGRVVELLVRDGKELSSFPVGTGPEPTPTTLYESEEYLEGRAVAWGEETALVLGEQVSLVRAGKLDSVGLKADLVAPAGEELVLARNGATSPMLGLGSLPKTGTAQIVAWSADGGERARFELEGEEVVAMAAKASGDVLVAVRSRNDFAATEDGSEIRLLLSRANREAPKEIARWSAVGRVEPAEGGWLVTGLRGDGRWGIFLADDAGASELLVSGSAIGVAITDGSLVFATRECLESSDSDYRRCIHRAELETVKRLGPRFEPFSTKILNQIGAGLAGELEHGVVHAFPPTREAIADFVRNAERSAMQLVGASLPLASEGVDALINARAYDRELSDRAVLLLSVLLAESLLQQGGEWVPTESAAVPARRTLGWELQGAIAVGLHPVTVTLSTLFEEEGWYSPVDSILAEADGRAVLVGVDAKAVEERVRESDIEGLDRYVREARVGRLADVLEAHPDNVYLRSQVYRHLAASGHRAEVGELARPFVQGERPEGIDLAASLSARLLGDLPREELEELIADLRLAIEKAPTEAGLYLLLGSAYERSSRPNRELFARACYDKAIETAQWGATRSDAEQALARLDEEEGE